MASREDGRYVVQFIKTPLPLVLAETGFSRWRVEFPPRRLSFAGRGKPPTRFLWLYLPSALAGELLPRQFSFEREAHGKWRLENRRSGEKLEGYLSR